MSSTLADVAAPTTFLTQVVSVEQIHPRLRRITLGGGDMTHFRPLGPDTFVYVLLPPPGQVRLTIDRSFTWEAFAAMAPSDQPRGAYYTVRAWRPTAAEVDLLMVLHGDEGAGSAWAGGAEPGDPVALWGPRAAYDPPADVDRMILVADDTGLPAAAAILESLPAGMPAWLLAEVDSPAAQQPLPTRPDTTVQWLYRRGAPPGTTTLLAEAVQALPWPGGRPYVWGAAERRTVAGVRAVVRQRHVVPREHTSLLAYWRRPRADDS